MVPFQSTLCATARALAIPEVVALIIKNNNLTRADLANLSKVCRYMSKVTVPFLWENAAADGLLQLIKSTVIDLRPSGRVATIRLDYDTQECDLFEDFYNYASYVKVLEVYDRDSRPCYTVEGWHILWTERAARNHPLLPNLRAVRFLNTSQSHGLDELKWLKAFDTPGLKEVSLMPNAPRPAGRIPFPIASTILGNLVNLHSNIQTLELAPSDDPSYPYNLNSNHFDTPLFTAALECRHPGSQPWYRSILALPRLRYLTVSEGWFYPAGLRALGRLTELKSLTVVPGSLDGFDHEFDIISTLPRGAFPELVELSLLGLGVYSIGSLLAIPSMLHHVTMMKLEFYFDCLDDDQYIVLGRVFKGLRSASCLRDLWVDYTYQPEYEEHPAKLDDTIKEMGPHPLLDYIYLGGIRIDKEWRRGLNLRYICSLGPIWPNVRTLSMPSQSASIRELEEFAALPCLTHLTLNLDLKYSYFPQKPDFVRAPLKTLESSGPVRLDIEYNEILLCAAALLRLWPSLTHLTWCDDDPIRTELARFFNSKILESVKELRFGQPRADAKLSAGTRLKRLRFHFEQIIDDLEETDGWNSDSDWDSDSEVEQNSELGSELESESDPE